jgi:hypothetical protein
MSESSHLDLLRKEYGFSDAETCVIGFTGALLANARGLFKDRKLIPIQIFTKVTLGFTMAAVLTRYQLKVS